MRIFYTATGVFIFLLSMPAEGFGTNGHQSAAIGAYQEGMAGAVTAAPYDASTAITNPAGMAMIGSRTDFSLMGLFPKRELSFGSGGGRSESGSRFSVVPAIGWTAPASRRGDLYFGGGMYGVSGMGVDYSIMSAPAVATAMTWTGATADIWSQYQFWKIAPTLAWTTGRLALGFALNLDYQAFGFKNMFSETGGGTGKVGIDLSEMQAAAGIGGTIGLLYQPVPAFALGISYASRQFFSDFKWRLSAGDVSNMPDKNGNPVNSRNGTYTMNLDFPQQAAFGIAIRPIRSVLWTADVKWINYNDGYDGVVLKGDFTGPSGSAKEIELAFGWENVMVYATAIQVDVTPRLSLRAGFNYSSSPIKRENVDNNLAFPAIARRRASGGFTYRLGRNWEMSMACMKTFREEVISNTGSETHISLGETAGDLELSYRF